MFCQIHLQLVQAASAGFAVPDTLITTDPEALASFKERHHEVVFKSISGIRSIVTLLTDEHLRRMERLRTCPTQFQQRVRGTNFRVHVVGSELFACRITSTAIDYRYDRSGRVIANCSLPDEIAARAVTLTQECGLCVAGLDLMKADDDQWYCFEINPSPGFSWFQDETNQPIPDAIAKMISRTP